jgi:uncharacterized protein
LQPIGSVNHMKPKVLFIPSGDKRHNKVRAIGCEGDCGCDGCDGGCDGDGACSRLILPSFGESEILDGSLFGKPLIRTEDQAHYFPVNSDYLGLLDSSTYVPLIVLNRPAFEILDFFTVPHKPAEWPHDSLIDYEDAQVVISQFIHAGLLQEKVANPGMPNSGDTKSQLESWIYLTRACNLFCAHCFVNKDVRRMSRETGLRAIERLFILAKKYGHTEIKIKYAGGEPTMNWDLIPLLHHTAKLLAQKANLGLSEILVTNATLLNRERLQFIKDEKIHLTVSMDGFGEGHDRQRPVLNGSPTFERVLKSVLLAIEMGVSPYLIISITRLNLKEVPALVAFALKHHLHLNLNFYRPHEINDNLVPDNLELTYVIQDALEVIETNLPDYNFMDSLIDRSNFAFAHQHVCGAGRNYLSIDTDGSALPCHMLTGYNMPSIPLQMLKTPRFKDFPNPTIDSKKGCNTCEWRYWCGGGCPIHIKNTMGTSDVSSPYCNVYKNIYPRLVRLQALQLIEADR